MKTVNSSRFPAGLAPLAIRGRRDASLQKPLKSIVWFEPERVSAFSFLAETYPEYTACVPHVNFSSGLLDLGRHEARAYITEFLLSAIDAWQIDILRIGKDDHSDDLF